MAAANQTPVDVLLHITDLHFWEVVTNPLKLFNKRFLGNANVLLRRRYEMHTERADEFARVLAATGVTTLLAGGDLSSTATDREFAMAAGFMHQLEQRGLRVIVMPGNHDRYTFEATRKRRFEQHFAGFLPAVVWPCRVLLPGGTPLILVPTVCPNMLSSRGRITDAELRRSAELLQACPPGPVLVAGHYPALDQTPTYRTSWARRLRNAAALQHTFGASGRTILYLAGHIHRFSYTQDILYPQLQHLCTPALFMARKAAAGAFCEVHVQPGGYHVYHHRRQGVWHRERQYPTLPESGQL